MSDYMKAEYLSEEDAIAVASAPYLYKKKDCVRAARTLRSIETDAFRVLKRRSDRPMYEKSCLDLSIIRDIRQDVKFYGRLAAEIEDHIKPARRRE